MSKKLKKIKQMERKISFRALTSGSGKMVYGDLIKIDNDLLIAGIEMEAGNFKNGFIEMQCISVFPDSVGQYIGIKDKNGKEIYEGDKFAGDEYNEFYVVEYNSNYARFEVSCYGYDMFHNEGGGEEFSSEISRIDCNCFDMDCLNSMEIIGNIHETTELLNG